MTDLAELITQAKAMAKELANINRIGGTATEDDCGHAADMLDAMITHLEAPPSVVVATALLDTLLPLYPAMDAAVWREIATDPPPDGPPGFLGATMDDGRPDGIEWLQGPVSAKGTRLNLNSGNRTTWPAKYWAPLPGSAPTAEQQLLHALRLPEVRAIVDAGRDIVEERPGNPVASLTAKLKRLDALLSALPDSDKGAG